MAEIPSPDYVASESVFAATTNSFLRTHPKRLAAPGLGERCDAECQKGDNDQDCPSHTRLPVPRCWRCKLRGLARRFSKHCPEGHSKEQDHGPRDEMAPQINSEARASHITGLWNWMPVPDALEKIPEIRRAGAPPVQHRSQHFQPDRQGRPEEAPRNQVSTGPKHIPSNDPEN